MDDSAREGLSEKQIAALDQFRENVQDILQMEHDDFYLLRWLRARNFDLKKSEEMLRKSMAWRKKWKVDTILTDWTPPEVLDKFYPRGFLGYDKEGSPVWLFPARKLHMKSISMSAKKSDILRFLIRMMETVQKQLRDQSDKLGKRVDKVVIIDDLDGFSMKQLFMPGMDVIFKFLGMVEANYPEILKTGYVINGPSIFPIIYRLIKPILSEDTKRKICILGRDWKEKLQLVIDADQLPVYWGGTAIDPDDPDDVYCQSRVCLGGEVPAEYFLKGRDISDDLTITKTSVARGDSMEIKFHITRSGLALRWVFWTEAYDIKFGIRYQANGSKDWRTVVASERVNCHQVPEDGFLECEQLGTYAVKFDNCYSWVHSKSLSYSIEKVNMDEVGSDTASVYSSASSSSQPNSPAMPRISPAVSS